MRRRQRLIEDRARGAEELPTIQAWEPVLMRPALRDGWKTSPYVETRPTTVTAMQSDAIGRMVADACPKCGRILKARGRHFHIRRCQGPK